MRISDWSSDVCSSDLVDDGGAKSADHAANAVDAEGVQRVIIAELRLQERHGIVADEGGDGTQDNGAERPRIASRRCDRNQTRDNARTDNTGRSLMSVQTHSIGRAHV